MVVFPAHAGMSLAADLEQSTGAGFPRSRGDEPAFKNLKNATGLFSPLTRG